MIKDGPLKKLFISLQKQKKTHGEALLKSEL